MPFNNREIASGIWLTLFLAWALTYRPVRQSLAGFFDVAISWKIVVPLGLMIGYTFTIVWALSVLGLWIPTLIKDTIIWFVLSGVVMLVTSVADKDSDAILGQVLKDSFKVILVVEFLIGAYTFSLPVELILVPALSFVALMDAYARLRSEHAQVAKFTSALLAAGGLAIFASVVHRALANLDTLASIGSLRQILLAPVLSTAAIPFVYSFVLFAAYESLFIRLGPVREDLDPRVRRYAKWRLVRRFKLSIKHVNRFLRTHALSLTRVRSKKDLDDLLTIYQG